MSRQCVLVLVCFCVLAYSEVFVGEYIEGVEILPQKTEEDSRSVFSLLAKRGHHAPSHGGSSSTTPKKSDPPIKPHHKPKPKPKPKQPARVFLDNSPCSGCNACINSRRLDVVSAYRSWGHQESCNAIISDWCAHLDPNGCNAAKQQCGSQCGSYTPPQPPPSPPSPPPPSGSCFRTSGAVNMRSSACGSTIVTLVPAGAVVTGNGGAVSVGSCSLGNYPTWQPVSYGGRSGYMASSLISSTSCGGGGNPNPPPNPPPNPTPNPPPSGGGTVVQNNLYKSYNSATQSVLQQIATTCGATVTPTGGGGGHSDFAIDKDYSTCFHAARTQSYLSSWEFIWHPGSSHCATNQHLHILSGTVHHAHGIDMRYPAQKGELAANKPDSSKYYSCQFMHSLSIVGDPANPLNVDNWCCFHWF